MRTRIALSACSRLRLGPARSVTGRFLCRPLRTPFEFGTAIAAKALCRRQLRPSTVFMSPGNTTAVPEKDHRSVASPDLEKPWTVRALRRAIRAHLVTFPSQVPVFSRVHRPDIQWRVVLLYFVRGWSSSRIGERYKIGRIRTVQILRQWAERAIQLGYVATIPPEA